MHACAIVTVCLCLPACMHTECIMYTIHTCTFCILFILDTNCKTVDIWIGTTKCTVSRARHMDICSPEANGYSYNIITCITMYIDWI